MPYTQPQSGPLQIDREMDGARLIVATIPGVSRNNLSSGQAATILGATPSGNFVGASPNGVDLMIHPAGGANGFGGLRFGAETIGSSNDFTFIWVGTPLNYGSINSSLMVRGADNSGAGWNLQLKYVDGGSLSAFAIDSTPAQFAATISGLSLTIGDHQRIALVKRGTTISVYDWRTRQSVSSAAGNGLLRSSALGIGLGLERDGATAGHSRLNTALAFDKGLDATTVWALLDNPWQVFLDEDAGGGEDLFFPAMNSGVTSASGSSAGSTNLSGVAQAISSAFGASSGLTSLTGAANAVHQVSGASAALASVSSVGNSILPTSASVASGSSVAGTARYITQGAGSSSSLSTTSPTARSIAQGTGVAAGSATTASVAAYFATTSGSSTGTVTINGTAQWVVASGGASSGASSVDTPSASYWQSSGSSIAFATVSGNGQDSQIISGVVGASGASAGLTSVGGIARVIAQGSGAVVASATLSATGAAIHVTYGLSSTSTTASGSANMLIGSAGSSAGTSLAQSLVATLIQAMGAVFGESITSAVSSVIKSVFGGASGVSTVGGVASGGAAVGGVRSKFRTTIVKRRGINMSSRFPFEYEHSVDANLDYSMDWTLGKWLQVGEVILSSVWVPLTTGVTITNQQNVGGITSAFIHVNTPSKVYHVVNTITTSDGRVDSRTLILSCKQR